MAMLVFSNLLRIVILVVASTTHQKACAMPTTGDNLPDSQKDEGAGPGRIATVSRHESAGSNGAMREVENHDLHAPTARLFLGMLTISNYIMWAITCVDVASRILSMLPQSTVSIALLSILSLSGANSGPTASHTPALLLASSHHLSFSFVVSAVAILLGYRIRKACFDTLGKHFTYTHTTLRKHLLVTNGPYSIVRHPGYVGMFSVRIGGLCVLLAQGSWASTVGAVPWPLSQLIVPRVPDSVEGLLVRLDTVAIGLYASHTVAEQVALLCVRAPREDTTLRERFGAEWKAYRESVPWMFVPYII